jgi:methionine-rich copper-binding protein CopC
MARRGTHALLSVVLVAASGVALLAHMKATRTEPASNATVTAAPARIQVWFTQAPDIKVSRLELSGPAGPVKLTGFSATSEKSIVAAVEGTLADGRYVARWQSAGDDGHVQKGEFAFSVKHAR